MDDQKEDWVAWAEATRYEHRPQRQSALRRMLNPVIALLDRLYNKFMDWRLGIDTTEPLFKPSRRR